MLYTSTKRELCIVIRPTDRVVDEQRRVRIVPGKRAEFFDFRYETQDPEIIEFLHNHPYRNRKFIEITESETKAVEKAKKVITGQVTTANVVDAQVDQIINAPVPTREENEYATRPLDQVAMSPELIRVIDERINTALGTIISLLKKDEKKEEAIMSDKPTKSFKCPYCREPFKSGFKVGEHKKVCEKRPK